MRRSASRSGRSGQLERGRRGVCGCVWRQHHGARYAWTCSHKRATARKRTAHLEDQHLDPGRALGAPAGATHAVGTERWQALAMEGAVDQLVFEPFIEQIVVPWLRPGNMVIVDNFSAHKREKAQRLVEGAGCC